MYKASALYFIFLNFDKAVLPFLRVLLGLSKSTVHLVGDGTHHQNLGSRSAGVTVLLNYKQPGSRGRVRGSCVGPF